MIDPRRDIFDAVRDAKPGIFDDPRNIHALDNLLDAFGVGRAATVRAASEAGIALIKQFEGLQLKAYPDPGTGGAPWTIGYGSTRDSAGQPIRPGTTWTMAEADAQFRRDLASFERQVGMALGNTPTSQGQYDALLSFAYNCGALALADSTLLAKHKHGDFDGVAAEFARWNKAAGKVLPGLTRRRAAEAEMYLRG